MKADYLQIEAYIMAEWLEECAKHVRDGYLLHKPDVLDKAAAMINLLRCKHNEMEKALLRADDELTAWFGEPDEKLEEPYDMRVSQTFTVKDTVLEIRKALGD